MNTKLETLLNQILEEIQKLNSVMERKKKPQKLDPSTCPFNLELAYKNYPRKEGKTVGMKALAKQIRHREDFQNLLIAVDNYREECRKQARERQFIKVFSTFANCWRDYIKLNPSEDDLMRRPIEVEAPTSFLT